MQIHNLTPEQKHTLEILWELEDLDAVDRYRRALPLAKQKEVVTLMEMVRLQALDDMIDDYTEQHYPDAKNLLNKLLTRH